MKKIIYAAFCFMFILSSCQEEEPSNSESLSLENQIEQQFRNNQITGKIDPSDITISSKNQTIKQSSVCENCDITLKFSSKTSGATAEVTVTDSSGSPVFTGIITSGVENTFTINTCETYNVTTQLLTAGTGNVQIKDGSTTYIVPVSSNQTTYQNYTFTCPVDEEVEECTITICIRYLSGTASGVHLGIFVNGNISNNTIFYNLSDGDCVTFTINENNTYEIRHIAVNPSPDFALSLNIDTQGYNLGYYMQGNFDTTGIISSQYLQCEEEGVACECEPTIGGDGLKANQINNCLYLIISDSSVNCSSNQISDEYYTFNINGNLVQPGNQNGIYYTFSGAGTYTIVMTYTVEDNNGCITTDSETIVVTLDSNCNIV